MQKRRLIRLFPVILLSGVSVLMSSFVVAPSALAKSAGAPATLLLSLDQGSIRADGRDAAALQIEAESGGEPVTGATIKLSVTWATSSPGSARLATAPFVTDNAGDTTAEITSTRSGSMTIHASIHGSAYVGTATIGLYARRRSVVIFANGASTIVTCPTSTTCQDPSGLFNPVRSALAAEGFTPDDMPVFSYAGGAVDPAGHEWIPSASTCAQSATSYKTEVGIMRLMVRNLASANPNTDFTLVGESQGALLVFQMIDALGATLSKGSRLVNIISLDGPLGGVPLAQILNLESHASTSCWSTGGTSPAAKQLVALWNTTAPSQGPQQGDLATMMCSTVGYKGCAAQTNEQAVVAASGINVETWGSSQDGVYDPPQCSTPGTWVDARETQVVTGAGGGLHAEGGVVPGPACTIDSHTIVIANHANDIATTVGPQQ